MIKKETLTLKVKDLKIADNILSSSLKALANPDGGIVKTINRVILIFEKKINSIQTLKIKNNLDFILNEIKLLESPTYENYEKVCILISKAFDQFLTEVAKDNIKNFSIKK